MANQTYHPTPGPIVLFGLGETVPNGQKFFKFLFKKLPTSPLVSILETPGELELNSEKVAWNVTIPSKGSEWIYPSSSEVNLSELGDYKLPDPQTGISPGIWNTALEIQQEAIDRKTPPEEFLELAEKREQARKEKDWQVADNLRFRIEGKGWTIPDSLDGSILEKIKK